VPRLANLLRTAGLIAALGLLVSACGGSSAPRHQATGPTQAQRQALAARTAAAARRAAAARLRVTNARPQPNWKAYAGQQIPILVYHDLGTPPASEPYPGLYVSDGDFEAEMTWLHSDGSQAITLDEMMNGFFHHGRLPAKPIVITFDNGYIPQATFAPAVMARYGWPGVLNEITVGHLSNARLAGLVKKGWEIDSHSLTHPDLTQVSASELTAQVVQSRQFLRHALHVPVNSFCYPSNEYDAAVVAAVKAAGYTNAVTENPGFATPSTDPFLLPRFEIEGGLSELQADLSSA
jgi:peptidoglycan/xylan/chitin deacetylase (PgdA/CDA1 family)